MISLAELRIGNLLWSEQSGYGEPERVFEISERDKKIWSSPISFWCGRDLEDLEPIPLTPAVLEACGFEYFDNIEDWGYKKLDIRLSDFEDYFYLDILEQEGITLEIRSIHQLQNIYYALTGQELTIDIDKLKNAVKWQNP